MCFVYGSTLPVPVTHEEHIIVVDVQVVVDRVLYLRFPLVSYRRRNIP